MKNGKKITEEVNNKNKQVSESISPNISSQPKEKKKFDDDTKVVITIGCVALVFAIIYFYSIVFLENKDDKSMNDKNSNTDIKENIKKEEEKENTNKEEKKQDEDIIKEDKKENVTNENEKYTSTCDDEEKSVYVDVKNNDLIDFDISFMKFENDEKNLVYSPLSIKYGLLMLDEGASGNTKKQIDKVIDYYKSSYYTDRAKHFSLANALFVNEKYEKNIKSTYTQNLSSNYNAVVKTDSFESDENMRKWVKEKTLGLIDAPVPYDKDLMYILINTLVIDMNWKYKLQEAYFGDENVPFIDYSVSYKHENYHDGIPAIQSPEYYPTIIFNGHPNTKSTKIGATINKYDIVKTLGENKIREVLSKEYDELLKKYGKEEYENACVSKEDAIQEHLSSLKQNYNDVQISTDFYYFDDKEITMFAKDLKEYYELNLQYVAIMPKNTSLKKYVDNLTAADLKKNIKKLKEIKLDNFDEGYITKITGNIPLFNIHSELDLINDLKKLNITDVFDRDKSDLSNLADIPSFIEVAKHEATIEFSNEGIRAGATTQLGGGAGATTSICLDYYFDVPVKTIEINFDNPYMFLIRNKDTGEVWFAGRVYEGIEQK